MVPIGAESALTRIQRGIEHFLSCIAERRQPDAGVADGVRALEIAEAAYRSVGEDRFVLCGADASAGSTDPRQTT
jgi:predicted dehydrogenase